MDELKAIEHLRQTRLKDLGDVAKLTKISRHTLIKIKYGTTKAPRWTLMKKLIAWAERKAA